MARLAANTATLRELFALSGNSCSFPNCEHVLVNEEGKFVAEICHIEGVYGERFNPDQSEEERRSAKNLILLCHRHHVETDDIIVYTVERMKQIKADHENKFKARPYNLPTATTEKILDDVNEMFEALFVVAVRTEQKIDSIAEQIKALGDKIAIPIINEEKYYLQQLDFTKELKKEQKHQTALKLLLDYKQKSWNKISDETKFKLIANIAFTYFELHDKKAASEAILELESVTFENEESLSLLSIAHAILKEKSEFENYFNKVKERNPENVNAWIAYITLHGEEDEFSENEIPVSILNNPEILYNLGEAFYNNGQKKKGIDYFKKSLSRQNISIEKHADIKAIIASRLLGDLTDPFKYIHNYNEDEKEELSSAINLLTEAWDVIKNTELQKSRFYIVMNRGVAYKLSRNKERALFDFQKAYDIAPEFVPFQNLFILYLEMNKVEQAEELLAEWKSKKDLSPAEAFDLRHLKARQLFVQGKIRDSIKELEKNMGGEGPNHLNTLCTIISFLLEKRLYDDAKPYCDQLKKDFPNEIATYVLSASLAFSQNLSDEGLISLETAFAMVDENTAPHEIYELASQYLDIGKYEKGAELFSKIADSKNANALSRGLIYAKYQAGNISEALNLASDLLLRDPASPFLAEIVINVFLEAKKIDQAAETVEKYLPLAPLHLKDAFLLKAAIIYRHKSDKEKAKAFLSQIQKEEKFSLNDIFNVARLLIWCDKKLDGMRVAYDARSRFYDQRAAHENYISTSLLVQQAQEQLFPALIAAESIIYTKDKDGQDKIFFISETPSPDAATTIHREDSIAKIMLGKSVGERFTIENILGSRLQLTVTSILNKYVFAFHQSMHLLETRFAGETDFLVLRNELENPLESLLNAVKQIFVSGNDFRKQALALYRQGMAPIGVLATIFKQNVVDQWFDLTNSNDVFLYVYSRNELSVLEEAIGANRPLIMDITSLLTLFFIYPEHHLFDFATNKIFIAQSTIDELEGYLNQLNSYDGNGKLSIGLRDGALIGSQITNDDIKKHRAVLLSIIEWCKSHADIRNPETLLTLKRDERVNLSETLSPAFFDSILLAKELQGCIVSDDDPFKKFSFSVYNVSCFSTYQWGLHLLKDRKISAELFETMTTQLVLANHVFIPLAHETLWISLEKAGFQIRKPFTIAVEGLKIVYPVFAAYYVVQFAKKLYLNPGLSTVREQILLFILQILYSQNSFAETKKQLISRIAIEFKFIPTYGDNFIELLNTF